ncbi:MAG: LLM class flavin-dependent oxidoreductase [Acidimicrobiales bacterium]|nr:LLM class flavin-dependent oxidoreductase [Acidimicrobiales bacterium]
MAWFAALCDDDHEFLGVADPYLRSSWEHCRNLALLAERHGFDSLLLPSGYAMGIDNVAFAAGIAPLTRRIGLLLAVRVGELVLPQLARQLATLDQLAEGRLAVNVISSDVPGEQLPADARYRRTLEVMAVLRDLLDGRPVDVRGEFVRLAVDPPRVAVDGRGCPPYYFGGLSHEARECAAAGADVYLTWPDTADRVAALIADVRARAARRGRSLRFGWRSHVIVRETEAEAQAAARRLLSRLDPDEGARIRARSLDSTSAGVRRQGELRAGADDEGYVERHLWTGVGRARSGAGAAIVGDPDQVLATLEGLRDLGVDAFILSGYPHAAECDLVARYVLPHLPHAPLAVTPQPVALA